MKIAFSVAFIGGIGGLERNIYSVAQGLSSHQIDIYTIGVNAQGFLPTGENVRISQAIVRPDKIGFRTAQSTIYDLYIHFAPGAPVYLGDHIRSRKRAIIPGGNDVRHLEHLFDYVICQAEDGIRYFDNLTKKVCITPPVVIPVNRTRAVENIPNEFFLTVFNPYALIREYGDGLKPCKGHDLVYEMADVFSLPLVWCHSNKSVKVGQTIQEHPKIFHLQNIAQERLYYLYDKATAYVSFSREEGFGWAVADAIMFDKPIISRRIGVLSSLSPHLPGLHIYSDAAELQSLISRRDFPEASYPKERFSPRLFEKNIRNYSDTWHAR